MRGPCQYNNNMEEIKIIKVGKDRIKLIFPTDRIMYKIIIRKKQKEIKANLSNPQISRSICKKLGIPRWVSG